MVQKNCAGMDDRVPDDVKHEDEAGGYAIESVPLLQEDQREEEDEDEDEEAPSPWRASSKSRIPMIVYLTGSHDIS